MNLYRRTWIPASAALVLAGLGLVLSAAGFQRSRPHKLRATALLEVITDAKGKVNTRLVPITILADGRFRDASIYESRPEPMALARGVVYEAQKTGAIEGYLTISGASNTPQGWVAEGKWKTAAQMEAAKPKPAAAPPAPADDRPILHREGQNPPPPAPAPAQAPTPPSDDRPVLRRGDDSGQQQAQSTSPSNPAGSAQTTESTAPEDPNRPVLRRRTPSGSDETETPAVPAHPAPSSSPVPAATKAPSASPSLQTFVAVSDAQPSDKRSYEFQWKPEEKEQIEARMRKLALAELQGPKGPLTEKDLTNVVIRSFDLDLSNDAVVVITAEAPGSLSTAPKGRHAAATPAPQGKPVTRYVAVIARVDIDGNPQRVAASVTDSSRLDVAPRLELIDAVDVDGDGIAELLFREYDFDQKTFLIYGVGHGTVTKMFEGASVPLQ